MIPSSESARFGGFRLLFSVSADQGLDATCDMIGSPPINSIA